VKTVLISPFFYPDEIGIALYNKLTVDYLLKNKYDVSIITAVPYYPEWRVKEPYVKAKLFTKEKYLEATVFRIKLFVPKNPTAIKRVLQLAHFTILSIRYVFSVPKDCKIIVVSPFTSGIITALLIKLFRGGKIWCHIQDFEFDAAIASFSFKRFIKLLHKIESFLFNRCDKVSTIIKAMFIKLQNKTSTPATLFPNFINIKNFKQTYKTHPYCNLSQKPQLLYSGNLGEKQDWDFFEKFCQEVYNNVDITIVGDGAMRDILKQKLKDLSNIRFFNLVPFRELPQLLCSFDGHILFQKKEVIDSVMPSKLIAMMLSGKPSFIYGNSLSESKLILEESAGGIFYNGNNAKEFSERVFDLLTDHQKRESMGNAAKKYAQLHFSDKNILRDFENNLKDL
jgi:colanic acid biosynthesis glycosyl transferase WcaI